MDSSDANEHRDISEQEESSLYPPRSRRTRRRRSRRSRQRRRLSDTNESEAQEAVKLFTEKRVRFGELIYVDREGQPRRPITGEHIITKPFNTAYNKLVKQKEELERIKKEREALERAKKKKEALAEAGEDSDKEIDKEKEMDVNKKALAIAEEGSNKAFSEATKKAFEEGNISSFFQNGMYGDILTIRPLVLRKNRARLRQLFPMVCNHVRILLDDYVPARVRRYGNVAYRETREMAGELGYWKQIVDSHPHNWPRTHLFKYLLLFRDQLLYINKASGKALETNNAALFARWPNPTKVFFPWASAPYEFLGVRLEDVFPHLCGCYHAVIEIIEIFITPPYNWRASVERSITQFSRVSKFKVKAMGKLLRRYAEKHVTEFYFSQLGIQEYVINYGSLCIELFDQAQDIPGIVTESIHNLLSQSKITKRVLGKNAYEEIKQFKKIFAKKEEE